MTNQEKANLFLELQRKGVQECQVIILHLCHVFRIHPEQCQYYIAKLADGEL